MTPRSPKCALTLLLTALALQAQTASFEVASIKPNNSGSGRSSSDTGPGRVTDSNVTIASEIQGAFGIMDFQISGAPGWVMSDKYDIQAITGTSKDLTDQELQPYFQALLADRCHLRYHRETKELPLYSMVPAKGGLKMTVHTGAGDGSTHITNGAGKTVVNATGISMNGLAGTLGGKLHRVVIDKTGLTDKYDIKLEWAPETADDSGEPSLFTALQEQLGLKLESTKGPVEIIVIDSIEKPTDN
jgi:uncharacterized protein (TIGR03435 family)